MRKLFDKVYKGTKEHLFRELTERMIDGKKTFVVTANAEIFTKAQKEAEVYQLLSDQDTMITPDGESIVKAAKMLGYDICEKIAGVDTVSYLLEEAAKCEKNIYVFGSKQDVLDAFADKYRKLYPNISFSGLRNGYDYQAEAVFMDMVEKKPDLILVALGVPRQEKLIYEWLSHFEKGVFIGVGGSIDVLSGKKKRAPQWIIKCKLEWLYRIFLHPDRWKRFYENNIKFMNDVRHMANHD